MDCIGKKVTYKFKIPSAFKESNYSPHQLEPKTGTVESLVVKLDKPEDVWAAGYNDTITHRQVGGPKDSYVLVSSGGARKTRKSRKSSKKTRKGKRHA